MNLIRVQAAAGLRVPLADNPHEYIEQEPVEVNGDDVYYRRLIVDGDLLVWSQPLDTQPETLSKKGKSS